MEHAYDADRGWVHDLEHVFRYGNRVSPRGMLCFESIAYKSVVSMQSPIIFNERRKLGYKFMAAEAAWILTGDNRVATIAPFSKEIAKFSDDGVTFFGAYGPKIKEQVDYVVANLYGDLSSRQAFINIWRENPGPSKDIPCTVSLQFLVRHNVLHCVATMRSSDLWLGHPYDIFNFSAVSFYILLSLNNMLQSNGDAPVQLGDLHLTAGSKHIYERNAEDVGTIIQEVEENGFPVRNRNSIFVDQYDDADEFVVHLWDCAHNNKGALSLIS